MNKQFDELAKDLAKGMSRRSAVRVFLSGIGAAIAGVLLSRGTAQAAPNGSRPGHNHNHEDKCRDHCEKLYGHNSKQFQECCDKSEECDEDSCCFFKSVNGTEPDSICIVAV